MDTLAELAAALNNDSDYPSNIQNQIILKADRTSVYARGELDTALAAKANVDGVFATLNNYEFRFVADAEFLVDYDKLTSYTQNEIKGKFDLKTLVYTKDELDAALLLKANTEGVFVTLNNYDSRLLADGKYLLRNDKATSYTQYEINDKLILKQDSWLTGVASNTFPLLSGKTTIRALAVTAPLTIFHNGSTHLTLGLDQTALTFPSKADVAFVNAELLK